MDEDIKLLLHTGNFAMQSALGFYTGNRAYTDDYDYCRDDVIILHPDLPAPESPPEPVGQEPVTPDSDRPDGKPVPDAKSPPEDKNA